MFDSVVLVAVETTRVNQCLEEGDSAQLITILQSPSFALRTVPECTETYYNRLLEAKSLKPKGNIFAWLTMHRTVDICFPAINVFYLHKQLICSSTVTLLMNV